MNVSVSDIIDNTPVFDRPIYHVNVSENAAVGSEVIRVVASDLDEDKKLFYTFYSAVSSHSLSKFKIDSETGSFQTVVIMKCFAG